MPLRLFVVADKIGGQVLGAFDRARMVAFSLCIPGFKPGNKLYLHSHMLGVLPEFRNTGIGRALKLKQREYTRGMISLSGRLILSRSRMHSLISNGSAQSFAAMCTINTERLQVIFMEAFPQIAWSPNGGFSPLAQKLSAITIRFRGQ